MRRRVVGLFTLSLAVSFAAGCGGPELEAPPDSPDAVESSYQGLVIFDRALAVTDKKILDPFTLERVMKQIVATSGVGGVNELQLFQQWWDTQNPGPGLGLGPHCDDEIVPPGVPGLNGYPWECPRGEGYQATVNPFVGTPDKHLYMPVGLFNRFDLAPSDGTHCGEYRIAFAMRPGHPDALGRNLLIFEAVLPNPNPSLGLMGCYPVAQFWYDLSFENDPAVRQKLLFEFYFNGLPGFPPVVHANHYGTFLSSAGYGCSTGQVRTNQFVGGDWNLREFRIVKDCRCGNCFLVFAPTTTKDNPFGPLFQSGSSHPDAPDLQMVLLGSVGSLGEGGVNDLRWSVPNELNTGESVSHLGGPYDYLHHFNTSLNPNFWNDISDTILEHGFDMYQPEVIVTRAQTQSCAGCHHTTNAADIGTGLWPPSIEFVHVDELSLGPAFDLSQAMQNHFLPHRAQVLEDFILSGGTITPNNPACRISLPPRLVVDCSTDAAWEVTRRSFHAFSLELLKPRLPESLGGARVH